MRLSVAVDWSADARRMISGVVHHQGEEERLEGDVVRNGGVENRRSYRRLDQRELVVDVSRSDPLPSAVTVAVVGPGADRRSDHARAGAAADEECVIDPSASFFTGLPVDVAAGPAGDCAVFVRALSISRSWRVAVSFLIPITDSNARL